MTRYNVFAELEQLTKMNKTENGYSKFIQTGNLSLYDYGSGFIELEVYTYVSRMDNIPRVRIWFGTVDDGDFGGWLVCDSKEQADELVERIAHEVFEHMVSFPIDEEINELLRPYGIYVTYE